MPSLEKRQARQDHDPVPPEDPVLVDSTALTFLAHPSLIAYRRPLTRPEHDTRPSLLAQPGPALSLVWMGF